MRDRYNLNTLPFGISDDTLDGLLLLMFAYFQLFAHTTSRFGHLPCPQSKFLVIVDTVGWVMGRTSSI